MTIIWFFENYLMIEYICFKGTEKRREEGFPKGKCAQNPPLKGVITRLTIL